MRIFCQLLTLLCVMLTIDAFNYITQSNYSSTDRIDVNNSIVKLSEDQHVKQQWIQMEDVVENLMQHFAFKALMPLINKLIAAANVSKDCRSSIVKVIEESASLEKWSLQMLDATAKFPPSGTLEGTLADLGRYDECLDVRNEEMVNGKQIVGQYCSVLLEVPLPSRPRFHTICNKIKALVNISSSGKLFRWLGQNAQNFYYAPVRLGICSPSVCTSQEIHSMVQTLVDPLHLKASIVNEKCEVKQKIHYNLTHIFICLSFAAVALTVILGTICDVSDLKSLSCCKASVVKASNFLKGKIFKRVKCNVPNNGSTSVVSTRKQWINILICFSIRKNASSLLHISEQKNDNVSLSFFHGLRVLTMLWIIFGHSWGLINATVYTNTFRASKVLTNIVIQGILNATVAVNTFFFISGFLTIYNIWKHVVKTNKFQPVTFTALRYLRLTPAYAAIIGFAFLFPLFGDGPLWRETVEPMVESCYQSWWTNLLYINNFVLQDNMCLMHSWYLANDLQFYLMAVIVTFALIRSRRFGFILMATLMLLSTAYSALVTAVNDYPPTIVSTSPIVEERWRYILDFYYKPWPHLSSYFIGLIVGYLVANKTRIEITDRQKLIYSLLFTTSTIFVLYGVYPWNVGLKVSSAITAIYSSTFRTIWTAGCAWITILLCGEKHKGFINECLSWKWFQPLSRLTFTAYLVHPFVVWYTIGTKRDPLNSNVYPLCHSFFGNYVITYFLAFIFGLLFESPFIALIKEIIKKNGHSSQQRISSSNELKLNNCNLQSDYELTQKGEASPVSLTAN